MLSVPLPSFPPPKTVLPMAPSMPEMRARPAPVRRPSVLKPDFLLMLKVFKALRYGCALARKDRHFAERKLERYEIAKDVDERRLKVRVFQGLLILKERGEMHRQVV